MNKTASEIASEVLYKLATSSELKLKAMVQRVLQDTIMEETFGPHIENPWKTDMYSALLKKNPQFVNDVGSVISSMEDFNKQGPRPDLVPTQEFFNERLRIRKANIERATHGTTNALKKTLPKSKFLRNSAITAGLGAVGLGGYALYNHYNNQ